MTSLPAPGPGVHGFGERGEPPLALGSVTGVRYFDFGGDPACNREPGELAGQYGGSWHDGENVAACVRDGQPTGHVPPRDGCGCGFWNYWEMDGARPVFNPSRAVLAVVEGYGRTVIGNKGFRSAKARIVALHVAFDFFMPAARVSRAGWRDPFTEQEQPQLAPDNDALKSGCEQLLAERYPSAAFYATERLMLIMHPPTTDYLPAPDMALGRHSLGAAVAASRQGTPSLAAGIGAAMRHPGNSVNVPLGNPPPGRPGKIIKGY